MILFFKIAPKGRTYKLQCCMVDFRMVFFIAFFSDFSRKGFVEN